MRDTPRPLGRGGLTFIEVMIVVLLTALIVPGVWTIVAQQRTAAERIRSTTESLHASRVTRSVLHEELGAGVVGRDWQVVAAGIVSLRAFRGWGLVCETPSEDELIIAYEGMRQPNASKDSLLVLDSDGSWWAEALVDRTRFTGECRGRRVPLERLRMGRNRPDAVLARVFERGEYHLTDGTLRYRLGRAGRQPLTTPAFDPDRSTITAHPAGARVHVEPSDTTRRGWGLLIRGGGGR